MDCFVAIAPRNDGGETGDLHFKQRDDVRLHSRDALRPRFAGNFPPSPTRGRREDRVRAAPAVSRADCTQQSAHEHTGSAETLRPSLRNGFTAYSELSPENGSFASVAP